MKDVQFGVFPALQCGSIVNAVAMSTVGSLLACGTGADKEKGEIQIWDYISCVRKAVIVHEKKVTGICFSHDD